MGTMRLQNEKTRAVGNMGVNARGDRIDAYGNVIDSKGQQLDRRIQKQTNVTETPIYTPAPAAPVVDPVAEEIVGFDTGYDIKETPVADTLVADKLEEVITETPAKDVNGPAKGLAGAIARSKTSKAKVEKDPKDLDDEEVL